MREVYAARITDAARLDAAMDQSADTWLTADQAAEIGLVDEVVQSGSPRAAGTPPSEPAPTGTPPVGRPATLQTRFTNRASPVALAASALLGRMGMADEEAKRHNANRGNPYQGVRLADLENPRLRAAGSGFAVGTDDFPSVLSNTANRAVGVTFMEHPEAWREICSPRQVPDFRAVTLVSMGAFPNLPSVGEHTEFEVVNPKDSGEEASLGTFAGKFLLSRRAVVNDDLGAFRDTSMRLGSTASRSVGDAFAALFNANAGAGVSLADGNPLFHADRNNIGTDAIASASVAIAYTKFVTLKDPTGIVQGSMPMWLLVPHALKREAASVLDSQYDVAADFASDRTMANRAKGLLSPETIVASGASTRPTPPPRGG